MSKDEHFRLKVLEHLVKTRLMPGEVRKSEKIISSLGFLLMLSLSIGPVLYFRDIGTTKYVLLLCGALSGIAAAYWQFYIEGNRQLRILHDFIDFESVKVELGSYNSYDALQVDTDGQSQAVISSA